MSLSLLKSNTSNTLVASHEFIPPATEVICLPTSFNMKRGGHLTQISLGFETWGTLNSSKSNVVLLFTGLSPNAHAASNSADPSQGWWEPMIGSGKAIDTDQYFVICFNSLGSCFGSTGPASINPNTGDAWRLDFPELSMEDIATSIQLGLKTLGIEHIHTAIGASMGGMSAITFALLFPQQVQRLALISTAIHSLPFAIAIRSLQREMICKDPQWMDGNYPFDQTTFAGMQMARKLGLASYRSADEWQQRFGRQRVTKHQQSQQTTPFTSEFQVESYLEYNATKFTGHFDANCYLYLSRALDWFDVLDYGKTAQKAFAQLTLEKALVIGVETDILFPVQQQQAIADALSHNHTPIHYYALDSIQGHDAFLVDYEQFIPIVRSFFQ